MDKYIKYHKKPHAKYLNVNAFNEKFSTEIGVSSNFDNDFLKLYKKQRNIAGHDEYIVGNLKVDYTSNTDLGLEKQGLESSELIEEQNVGEIIEEQNVGELIEEQNVGELIEEQNVGELIEEQKLEDVLEEEKVNIVEKKEISLEEALNDNGDIQKQIEEIVLERAKDEKQAEMDLKNIVHFNNGSNVRDRLMKGTKQNIEQLKSFLDGYTDETVRLSYKKNDKNVKISQLNPDIESLKEFLSDYKNIREVKCSV